MFTRLHVARKTQPDVHGKDQVGGQQQFQFLTAALHSNESVAELVQPILHQRIGNKRPMSISSKPDLFIYFDLQKF